MASEKVSEKIFQFVRAALFFAWSAMLLIVAVLPSNDFVRKSNETPGFRLDYLEHFLAFIVLALLFGSWWKKNLKSKNRETLLFLLAGGMYAAATELVQILISSRTFNPNDLLFNLGGLIIGTALTRIYIFK